MRLVLASASPRRAALLREAGFAFDVVAVDVDERALANETPSAYVGRLAAEKSARAMEVLRAGPPDRLRQGYGGPPKRSAKAEGGHYVHDAVVVLGADTAVVVDQQLLGKPRDNDEARAMLRRLSGRAHQVMTGVSLRSATAELGGVETTEVWFAPLTPGEIGWYVSTGEGRDKAGAYAIQGLASRFIPRISGSYSNVVGLPIEMVSRLLHNLVIG